MPRRTDLEKLYYTYPEYPWDYSVWLTHPGLTLHLFLELLRKKHVTFEALKTVSYNPSLTTDWFYQFGIATLWDFAGLSRNAALDISWTEYFPQQLFWNFTRLSQNHALTFAWFKLFPGADWNFYWLSGNNFGLTAEWISCFSGSSEDEARSRKFPNAYAKWNFYRLSSNLSLTHEWFEAFPGADWDMNELSANRALKPEWIKCFPDGGWNFPALSRNNSLTVEWFEAFPDTALWDFKALAENTALATDWFDYWNVHTFNVDNALSKHPALSVDWLDYLPNESDWNFSWLSTNPALTIEFLDHFQDGPWDHINLSDNRGIEVSWIKWAESNKDLRRCRRSCGGQRCITTWIPWNRGLTTEFFKLENFIVFNVCTLSKNPALTPEWFEYFPDAALWDFTALSSNKSLSIEWLARFPDADWDINGLVQNLSFRFEWLKHLPMEEVTKYFERLPRIKTWMDPWLVVPSMDKHRLYHWRYTPVTRDSRSKTLNDC